MTICRNATQAFEMLYQRILTEGCVTEIGTKAIYNVAIEISNPTDRVITSPWRKFKQSYAEREWQWYLTGNPSTHEIERFAPMWKKMHNGNQLVQSNYGWQWQRNGQLQKCIEQLKNNRSTRQAWITIYDGKEKDNYAFDTPCTIGVGFSIKPNKSVLDMTVLMRSNDLIFGFCNDQYCFSKLQEYVAEQLGRGVGSYVHFAHDMHIYNEHLTLREDFYKNQK